MKIFIAGNGGYRCFVQDNFYDFFRLISYHNFPSSELNLIHKYKDFILDSGVFSFLSNSLKNIDWEEYLIKYADFVRNNKIKNYVELDIDKFIGLDSVEILRRKLEARVGWKTMPVWHMNRGYDKWLEIVRDYEYVCFGAFLTDNLKKKRYSAIKIFLDDARKNKCKVHGLGMTNPKFLDLLPFYSVDSSTWSCGNRFGSAFHFNGQTIKAIPKPRGFRITKHKLLERHNFYEWIKFANFKLNQNENKNT